MINKVVMITGATNGIGKASAIALARQGAITILVGRNQSKLNKTAQEIQQVTGNQQITTIQADLSSLEEIRAASKTFLEQYNRLDVLINNAGAMFIKRQESADGFEMTLALNHLNYFLLTHLLLDVLKQTAQAEGEARIINVASSAHAEVTIDFADLQYENFYSGFAVYGQTKLMNILFTYALHGRLKGTNITTNAVHPGSVRTGFGQNNGFLVRLIMNVRQLFQGGLSAEKGAETIVYLASAPEVRGITGKYWIDKRQVPSSEATYDKASQTQLWQLSETMTQLGLTNSQ